MLSDSRTQDRYQCNSNGQAVAPGASVENGKRSNAGTQRPGSQGAEPANPDAQPEAKAPSRLRDGEICDVCRMILDVKDEGRTTEANVFLCCKCVDKEV